MKRLLRLSVNGRPREDAVAAGGWFKFTLITRAGFNQGFALARLPVRGVRR